jgi:hypothetical protein
MIEISTTLNDKGKRVASEKRGTPSIYLDHWALRDISQNPTWAKRFREGLLSSRGSLALSLVNLGEFSQVADMGQIAAAEQFVDSLLPNIFWQDVSYPVVIEAENRQQRVPAADVDLLDLFTLEARTVGAPLSMRGRLAVLTQDSGANKSIDEAGAAVLNNKIQREYFPQFDEMGKKGINKLLKSTRSRAEALFIATIEHLYNQREGRRRAGREDLPLKKNDVLDIIHMIVPVSFCNYVLLDSNTCQIVGAITNRLKKIAGQSINIAKVYKKAEVETFLSELETTDFDVLRKQIANY